MMRNSVGKTDASDESRGLLFFWDSGYTAQGVRWPSFQKNLTENTKEYDFGCILRTASQPGEGRPLYQTSIRISVIYSYNFYHMMKTSISVISIVLLVVGVLGFFSDPLLGIFAVDPLHNIVHLLTGVLGLLSLSMDWDQMFAKVFGVVYAVVAVLGFWMGGLLGMMMNTADNVLHLVLAAAFLCLGFWCSKEASMSDQSMPNQPMG